MISLTKLGLTLDPLVRTFFALFLCVLTIPLVVLMFLGLVFCTNRSQVQMWYFCVWSVFTITSHVQRWLTQENILVLKLLILFPNLKLSFIVIVIVRLCLTYYNYYIFTKNMIWRAPMGTIHRPSNPGSRGTETTSFIQ